jgi:hypothetical protein
MKSKLIIIQICIFILSIFGLANPQDQTSPMQKSIIPFGRPGEVRFDAGKGKTYKYYRLVKGQSMGFAVEGPTNVEIRSRAGLSGPTIQADYQIQVWDGEFLAHADKLKSKLASARLTGTSLLPASAKLSQFEVPAGVHNYRLWLVSDNVDTAFVRLFASQAAAQAPARTTMLPLEYNKLVHLYSKKNQTAYFLIDKTNGVKLKINGPVDLIVTARANFRADMLGRIGYSISVFENEKEFRVLSAMTSKSLTMAYQDYSGVVPSQPSDFILKIPAGMHILNFILKESDAETISIRFSLPQQVD